MKLKQAVVEVNGIKYLNVTPHALNFGSGVGETPEFEFIVKPSGMVLHAVAVEVVHSERPDGVRLVQTAWQPSDEDLQIAIDGMVAEGVIVVGSAIAAQAYRGVCVVTPATGYERRPPAEKRMNPRKFTIT